MFFFRICLFLPVYAKDWLRFEENFICRCGIHQNIIIHFLNSNSIIQVLVFCGIPIKLSSVIKQHKEYSNIINLETKLKQFASFFFIKPVKSKKQ